MSDFSYNSSILDEKYNILLSKDLIRAIRVQARILLIPFFKEVAIQSTESEKGIEYPKLTELAERIIQNVFNDGQLDYESYGDAKSIAVKFIGTLKSWQKACLSLYFCSDSDFLDKLDEENQNNETEDSKNVSIEELYIEDGRQIQKAAYNLTQNDKDLADFLVEELIHLQDIFSTEDISYWDAASITNANENFEIYAGKGQILMPVSHNEYEYWDGIMGIPQEDDEDGQMD